MNRLTPLFLVSLGLLGSIQGCAEVASLVPGGEEMTVRLHVTGGIAAADYTVVLDGGTRVLVGESCTLLCDFEPGEVLVSLSSEQVDYLWALFLEAGIHALDGEDFGVQCCDQFHYDLEFEDAQGVSRVQGSSEALPEDLRTAVATLQGMVAGNLPVIVAFETDPSSWPSDAFQIQDAAVEGQNLQIRLSYGGGCRTHDVKVIAWGGWLESDPVQVRLFVSHEDFDDPCDAWVTRDFTIGLTPLKLAYQASYGVSEPGKTTLILLLEDPLLASPLGARWLEYRF